LGNGKENELAVLYVRTFYDIGQLEVKEKHIDVLSRYITDNDDLLVQLLWGKLVSPFLGLSLFFPGNS
jgi:hypothetical protein